MVKYLKIKLLTEFVLAYRLYQQGVARLVEFFKHFLEGTSPFFVGPLLALFWTSGDICPWFLSQGGYLVCVFHPLSITRFHPLVRHLPNSWWSVLHPSRLDPITFSSTGGTWCHATCATHFVSNRYFCSIFFQI